jgi:hypothetical protein
MKRFTGLKFLALAVVAGAMSSPAWATLSIIIGGTTGATTYTVGTGTQCNDQASCDGNSTVGTLTTSFSTSLGSATITGTSSTSGSPIGTLGVTINLTATSTGSFTVGITDTNYNSPAPPNLQLFESVGGTQPVNGPQGTVSSIGTFSANNTMFNMGGAGTTSTTTASTSFGAAQGQSQTGLIAMGNPYSLFELITINITSLGSGNNKQFQINADLNTAAAAVPEPASILLLGSALLLSVTALKRKYGRS